MIIYFHLIKQCLILLNSNHRKCYRDNFENVSVASKRYLVHKVDRSVGGLVCKTTMCRTVEYAIADSDYYSISHVNFFGFNGALPQVLEKDHFRTPGY